MRFVCTSLGLLAILILRPAISAAVDLSSSEIISKTEEYVSRLLELMELYEANVVSATRQMDKINGLYQSGLVARKDLEACRKAGDEAQARVAETRGQIEAAGRLIAEIKLAEEMERGREQEPLIKDAVIFHAGRANWSLADAAKVENHFIARFGIAMPVSAVGQTELHTRMGYNHQGAIDVAIHPDSPEGQDLMEFLRTSGFTFVAFRKALPGSATGAHIHIGLPSNRIVATNRSNHSAIDKAGS